MHTTEITSVRCPECGAKVAEIVRQDGFQAGGSTIGPSSMRCPGCGCGLLTGQSEWDEKSFAQKTWFLIGRVTWLLVSSLVVASAFASIVTLIVVEYRFVNPAQKELCFLTAYCVGTALIGFQLFRNAAKEIRESKRRTRDAESY